MTVTITTTLAHRILTCMLPADEAWEYRVKLFDMGRPIEFTSGDAKLGILPCLQCEGFSLSGSAEDIETGLRVAGGVPMRPESCSVFGFPDGTWGLK